MLKRFLLCLVLLVALLGCAGAQSPVTGFIYTGVEAPVAYGENGTSNKMGESCATSILGLIAVGDASINAAKNSGNIGKVTSIDHSSTSFLGIFAKYCTLVRGS